MAEYKDELGRDYIDLRIVAEVLGYTTRHVKRLARRNNWLSIKRGRPYILKSDFLESYSDLGPALMSRIKTDKVDISDKSGHLSTDLMSGMSRNTETGRELDPLNNKEIVYQKTVSTLQKLERTIASMNYLQQDTHNIREAQQKQQQEMKIQTQAIQEMGRILIGQKHGRKRLTTVRITVEIVVGTAAIGIMGLLFWKVWRFLEIVRF